LDSKCPGFKCKTVCGEQVYELLLEPEKYSKYKNQLLLSFVDDSLNMAWCPQPKCGRVVNGSNRKKTIECSCQFQFCFQCKTEAHAPTTCQEAEQWRGKDKGSQSLDMKYLMEQTKPCPSCGVRTKKDGGCMYITCSSCKKPWCWQCGKSDHHVWECNRPPYSMEKEQADKDDTNRYLFYFERYYNHSQSVKFAEAQRDKAQKTISQLMDGGKTFQEVDFLCQAVELVVECRRVLMWTYAKAYCMKQPGPARELFEYQQSELEKFTEMLNKLTEESPEELNKESGKKESIRIFKSAK